MAIISLQMGILAEIDWSPTPRCDVKTMFWASNCVQNPSNTHIEFMKRPSGGPDARRQTPDTRRHRFRGIEWRISDPVSDPKTQTLNLTAVLCQTSYSTWDAISISYSESQGLRLSSENRLSYWWYNSDETVIYKLRKLYKIDLVNRLQSWFASNSPGRRHWNAFSKLLGGPWASALV